MAASNVTPFEASSGLRHRHVDGLAPQMASNLPQTASCASRASGGLLLRTSQVSSCRKAGDGPSLAHAQANICRPIYPAALAALPSAFAVPTRASRVAAASGNGWGRGQVATGTLWQVTAVSPGLRTAGTSMGAVHGGPRGWGPKPEGLTHSSHSRLGPPACTMRATPAAATTNAPAAAAAAVAAAAAREGSPAQAHAETAFPGPEAPSAGGKPKRRRRKPKGAPTDEAFQEEAFQEASRDPAKVFPPAAFVHSTLGAGIPGSEAPGLGQEDAAPKKRQTRQRRTKGAVPDSTPEYGDAAPGGTPSVSTSGSTSPSARGSAISSGSASASASEQEKEVQLTPRIRGPKGALVQGLKGSPKGARVARGPKGERGISGGVHDTLEGAETGSATGFPGPVASRWELEQPVETSVRNFRDPKEPKAPKAPKAPKLHKAPKVPWQGVALEDPDDDDDFFKGTSSASPSAGELEWEGAPAPTTRASPGAGEQEGGGQPTREGPTDPWQGVALEDLLRMDFGDLAAVMRGSRRRSGAPQRPFVAEEGEGDDLWLAEEAQAEAGAREEAELDAQAEAQAAARAEAELEAQAAAAAKAEQVTQAVAAAKAEAEAQAAAAAKAEQEAQAAARAEAELQAHSAAAAEAEQEAQAAPRAEAEAQAQAAAAAEAEQQAQAAARAEAEAEALAAARAEAEAQAQAMAAAEREAQAAAAAAAALGAAAATLEVELETSMKLEVRVEQEVSTEAMPGAVADVGAESVVDEREALGAKEATEERAGVVAETEAEAQEVAEPAAAAAAKAEAHSAIETEPFSPRELFGGSTGDGLPVFASAAAQHQTASYSAPDSGAGSTYLGDTPGEEGAAYLDMPYLCDAPDSSSAAAYRLGLAEEGGEKEERGEEGEGDEGEEEDRVLQRAEGEEEGSTEDEDAFADESQSSDDWERTLAEINHGLFWGPEPLPGAPGAAAPRTPLVHQDALAPYAGRAGLDPYALGGDSLADSGDNGLASGRQVPQWGGQHQLSHVVDPELASLLNGHALGQPWGEVQGVPWGGSQGAPEVQDGRGYWGEGGAGGVPGNAGLAQGEAGRGGEGEGGGGPDSDGEPRGWGLVRSVVYSSGLAARAGAAPGMRVRASAVGPQGAATHPSSSPSSSSGGSHMGDSSSEGQAPWGQDGASEDGAFEDAGSGFSESDEDEPWALGDGYAGAGYAAGVAPGAGSPYYASGAEQGQYMDPVPDGTWGAAYQGGAGTGGEGGAEGQGWGGYQGDDWEGAPGVPQDFMWQVQQLQGEYGRVSNALRRKEEAQDEFLSAANKELGRISRLLDSRETELNDLKEELQETKAQLSIMQSRAEAELSLAKHQLLEKDVQLRTAEAAMGGLEKVTLEYWGAGSAVRLAGSFNGWQHHVPLRPDISSEIAGADGSRGPMMWDTTLWLYPGVYEVKFIVDGHWLVDPRREVVHSSQGQQNNLLRVEMTPPELTQQQLSQQQMSQQQMMQQQMGQVPLSSMMPPGMSPLNMQLPE